MVFLGFSSTEQTNHGRFPQPKKWLKTEVGDAGFDPAGFAKNQRLLPWYREVPVTLVKSWRKPGIFEETPRLFLFVASACRWFWIMLVTLLPEWQMEVCCQTSYMCNFKPLCFCRAWFLNLWNCSVSRMLIHPWVSMYFNRNYVFKHILWLSNVLFHSTFRKETLVGVIMFYTLG